VSSGPLVDVGELVFYNTRDWQRTIVPTFNTNELDHVSRNQGNLSEFSPYP